MVDMESGVSEALHAAGLLLPRRHSVRFRIVLAWVGLALIVVAGATLTVAGALRAPDMIFLAGAYGAVGSLTVIGSAFHG